MTLTRLQKITLFTTGAAAAHKILLYALGLHAASVVMVATQWGAFDAAAVLRVVFALLSFVAFDLVIYSIAVDLRAHGVAPAGVIAAGVAALMSTLIALDVADANPTRELAAGGAVTLAAYFAHLVFSHAPKRPDTATPQQTVADVAASAAAGAAAGAALATLPRTVREFIAVRARELGTDAPAVLASELGTSADTVRRALAVIQAGEES